MDNDLIKDSQFKQWLTDLKIRIRQSQLKAAVKVNAELLHLYWDLGRDIVVRQMDAVWGSGFYSQLSKELKAEFPDMQGFSITNLNYCKRFFQFYTNNAQQQISNNFYPQVGGEISDEIFHQAGGKFHGVIISNIKK